MSDFYFERGLTHKVCQDYAMAQDDVIVVSDGCSSSPDTDWGARLLCRTAIMASQSWDGVKLAIEASHLISKMALDSYALDATLLVARRVDKGVEVRAWGDGVYMARNRETGRWTVYVTEFAGNAPAYINYLIDETRYRIYMNEIGGRRRICGYYLHEDSFEQFLVTDTFGFPTEGDSRFFPSEVYDLVVLCSDGVQSFQRRKGRSVESVPVEEVLRHFDFRGPGESVTRTMRWFFNKFCPAEGWQHVDDVAVAAIEMEAPDALEE